MKVKFKDYFMGVEKDQEMPVEDFTAKILLHSDGHLKEDRVRLEEQPGVVAEALGRLMDTLIAKGVLTGGEFLTVLGIHYGREKIAVVPDTDGVEI